MAIAIYARKSTESEDRQVQSLDDQLNAMRALAARENLSVSEVFVESKSAKAPYTRPEFARLIAKVESGEITGVLTWAINRLTRNLVDGGTVAHLLQHGKLEFIRTPERVYRPEDSVLMISIENGMATSFIQDLSRNVKRGLTSKAEKGWFPGRAPLGYRNNSETHEVEIDPVRFHLVRKGWQSLLTGGFTQAEIYRQLKSLGLTNHSKKAKGTPVTRSAVYSIFKNPFYGGQFRYRGELRQGSHQPMVTPDEFELAQMILCRSQSRRYRKHDHQYTGLLHCAKCGCKIVAETKRKHYKGTNRTAEYVYYHCTGARGCSKSGISQAELTSQIVDILASIKVPAEFAKWASQELARSAESDALTNASSLAELNRQVAVAEKRLATLNRMRLDEEISQDEYRALKGELDSEVSSLRKNAAEVASSERKIQSYVRRKIDVAVKAAHYSQLPVSARRGLIQALGDGHCLNLKNLELQVDPIIEKIAAFELLRNGSQIPKVGDLLPVNSVWQGLINDIRTAARLIVTAQVEQGREKTRALHERAGFCRGEVQPSSLKTRSNNSPYAYPDLV